MERESFIFYRSFYEAVRDLPKEIQIEVFTAVIEYGLYGRLPDKMKPFANGIFTLIKPSLDANTARYENGRKGGRRPRAAKATDDTPQKYSLTFSQEIGRMRADAALSAAVCADFAITPDEYLRRLDSFLRHCTDEARRKDKPDRHGSYADATAHLRYWMTKAFPRGISPSPAANPATPPDTPADYSFKGGFGGQDV